MTFISEDRETAAVGDDFVDDAGVEAVGHGVLEGCALQHSTVVIASLGRFHTTYPVEVDRLELGLLEIVKI